jgi:predicted amidohydrolase YtcJ
MRTTRRTAVQGLKVALALALSVTGGASVLAVRSASAAETGCPAVRDVLLTHGAIHTMDAADHVVGSVRILGDRIVATGNGRLGATRCTQVIDVRGRTVVPGLIDNHNHVVALGLRPGHDTRLESATSIADVLALIGARTQELPAGEWITAIGGFDINQFVPAPGVPRFPTLAELDRVAPSHPVYLQMSFAGPGATNSAGKRFFESKGIVVGPDGAMAGGATPNPCTRALLELRKLQTLDDQKRGTLEALRYAASLGITTEFDQGGFPASGTANDGAAHFDRIHGYDALKALDQERKLPGRVRVNFLHMETDPQTPELIARLDNAFPRFGGDMLKTVGIGEFTAGASPIILAPTDAWINGTKRVALAGWRNENHSLTPADFKVIIEDWEQVARDVPRMKQLRWVVAHVPFITREYADRLKAIGGGVNVLGGWRYISGTAQQNGPPFRMLKESGIPMGMSSDGMQIAPMSPWLGLYYVVTGRNARGETINGDQTLTRAEGLRLYTAANGWFLNEEAVLGTIEPGKYADLAVLSANYFDERAVPDEALKKITSVLTLVGGNIVFGETNRL